MRFLRVYLAVGLVTILATQIWPIAAGSGLEAEPVVGFVDTFNHAVDQDPGYGLNDSLARRQGIRPAVTYTRVPGVWYEAPAPRPWFSQVNHVNHPGVLSFWLGTSAVRMDAPVVPGADGRVVVGGLLDPVSGDTGSGDWIAMQLSSQQATSGYVADADVAVGLLVRSNGGIQLFQRGTALLSRDRFAPPGPQGRFQATMSYVPGGREVEVTVNGVGATVGVASVLPARGHLYLGAYLGESTAVSTIDNLGASKVDRSGLGLGRGSGLRYFGYYAARLAPAGAVPGGGSHLGEVAGRANLNWVNISDYDRYAPEVLDSCAPRSCVVYTGHEFFRGCDVEASPTCDLYPDYQARWARLAAVVRPRLDRVGAFYLLDEPYHRGASAAELATSAALIKATFPQVPVMLVEAGPQVTTNLHIPTEVTWVGFDWYCRPIAEIEQVLTRLEARLSTAAQRVFLLPETAPLCGGQTDAQLAQLQWDYLRLAQRHPKVIGLMAFGLWTSGSVPSDLPLTIDAHERIAARILPP